MKFRNPETGEVFEDISDALEDAYQRRMPTWTSREFVRC